MKARLTLFLLAFAVLVSWGGELFSDAALPKGVARMPDKERAVYDDLKSRLEAAVSSRDVASVAALYQTNDVSPAEMKSELARWRPVLGKGAKPSPPYLKVLSRLPPESHEFWQAQAHRLTRHQVTAFAIVRFQDGSQMELPLALVGEKFLIVPSEKISTKVPEPGGAANRSQPPSPSTNRPASAAGSGG